MDEQTISKEQTKAVEDLFKLGAHLGHKKNRLHPKARKYVYQIINGVSVIDLTLTVQNLDQVKKLMKEYAKDGKKLLVVCTKKVASHYVLDLCEKHQIPSVTTKWLPGLLTNFDTIIKNMRHLKDLREQKEKGEWDQFVKHERMALDKEVSKLTKFYGGIIHLDKKPDIIFVVDIKKEKNAIKEAKMNKIPVFAIVDTNSNPDEIKDPIMINDDSFEVLQYILNQVIEAYVSGKSAQV